MRWEDQLDAAQLPAALHRDGPAQVIAGPGSGKTRTLTYRIAILVDHHGVDPRSILALTFTKKAADEMSQRLAFILTRHAAERVQTGTIHGFCYGFLRRNAHRPTASPLVQKWTGAVMTEWQQRRAWERATDPIRNLKAGVAAERVEAAKNAGLTRDRFKDLAVENDDEQAFHCAEAWRVYERIQLTGAKDGSHIDFEDMLLETSAMLATDRSLRDDYRSRIAYLLVDEAQDCNPVQWAIAAELAPPPAGNLMVVGDADQAIYAFRGASPGDLVRFDESWTEARTYILDRNYRSTRSILGAANALIAHNEDRHPKDLWTDNPRGPGITVRLEPDAREEATYIVDQIRRALQLEGVSYQDTAVLVRCWWQTRAIEDAFLKAKIPYIVIGGPSFYGRREIRDILAYLEAATHPGESDDAIERIFNVPNRYLGNAAREAMEEYADRRGVPLDEAMLYAAYPKPYMAERARELHWALSQLHKLAKVETPPRVIEAMLTYTHYRDYLRKEDDGVDRLDNVDELLDAATAFDSCEELVFYARQVEESQPSKEAAANAVELMTVHRAKGKEFHTVAVAGFASGIFPHARAEDLEEERRIAFVAMTRAEQRLMLTLAQRYRNTTASPSPFIVEAGLEDPGSIDLKPVDLTHGLGEIRSPTATEDRP